MGVRRRLAALSLVVLCAAPAAAWADAASPSPCERAPCRYRLMVGATVRSFHTDEVFDSGSAYVSVRLYAEGRPLREVSASGTDGCRRTLRGFGFEATVSSCLEVGPVRVTAARLSGDPAWLTVTCRTWPYLDSGPGGSSSASGGATAHR